MEVEVNAIAVKLNADDRSKGNHQCGKQEYLLQLSEMPGYRFFTGQSNIKLAVGGRMIHCRAPVATG